MIRPGQKLAIYMEGAVGESSGKMGNGVLRYSPHEVVAVIDSRCRGENLSALTGVPRNAPIVASVEEAAALGAEVLILGIAPSGGRIPDEWNAPMSTAVELGLSLVNGLHDQLAPRFPSLKPGQFVWDIRREPEGLEVGSGAARELPGRRVLFIGTDMACGKMTAGLEIFRVARDRGVRTHFVATGQIGITIMGSGVPLDAVRVDYASGAIERETLRDPEAELILIEGQGSLLHPGSTANLPLLRGSVPTHLVLCHRAGQTTPRNVPWITIPPLREVFSLYQDLAEARGSFLRPLATAIALNTAHLTPSEAEEAQRIAEAEVGLPVVDPVRDGADRLVDALLA